MVKDEETLVMKPFDAADYLTSIEAVSAFIDAVNNPTDLANIDLIIQVLDDSVRALVRINEAATKSGSAITDPGINSVEGKLNLLIQVLQDAVHAHGLIREAGRTINASFAPNYWRSTGPGQWEGVTNLQHGNWLSCAKFLDAETKAA